MQNGPQGQYVFVVKPDQTAELRVVKVERVDAGRAIVVDGLKPGETVVTTDSCGSFPARRSAIRKPQAS